jgi:hypothetical protein
LINAITLWLSLNFALPPATATASSSLYHQNASLRSATAMIGRAPDSSVLGAYDARSRTIYLQRLE